MIVTLFAAARSRAARRSPRSISRRVARATVKGLPWYLRRTPSGGVAVLAPSSRYQASGHIVNGANHQDPVMAAYMVGGQPGSVTKARASVMSHQVTTYFVSPKGLEHE